jgi:hypothetical protein
MIVSKMQKTAFWYLDFSHNLIKCYHSSIFVSDFVGYAVLDPPEESFFKSSLIYNKDKKMDILIYTNDTEKARNKYDQYLDYLKKLDLNAEHVPYFINTDGRTIISCLKKFNEDVLNWKSL